MRNVMSLRVSVVTAVLVALVTVKAATAAPTNFAGTGHYYQLVDGPITWEDARIAAENTIYLGVNGYLLKLSGLWLRLSGFEP